MERMGEEFGHLLTSQLDSQRAYYTSKMAEIKEEIGIMQSNAMASDEQADYWRMEGEVLGKRLQRSREEAAKWVEEKSILEQRVADLENRAIPTVEKEKAKLQARFAKASEFAHGLQRELDAEKEVTRGLVANMAVLRGELMTEKASNVDLRSEVRVYKGCIAPHN